MTLAEYHFRKVPEYYDFMYLDGFTPEEIMYALRKKMKREIMVALQNAGALLSKCWCTLRP